LAYGELNFWGEVIEYIGIFFPIILNYYYYLLVLLIVFYNAKK